MIFSCSSHKIKETTTEKNNLISFLQEKSIKKYFLFEKRVGYNSYVDTPIIIHRILADKMIKNLNEGPLEPAKYQVSGGKFGNVNKVIIEHRMFKSGDRLIIKMDNEFYYLLNYSEAVAEWNNPK